MIANMFSITHIITGIIRYCNESKMISIFFLILVYIMLYIKKVFDHPIVTISSCARNDKVKIIFVIM